MYSVQFLMGLNVSQLDEVREVIVKAAMDLHGEWTEGSGDDDDMDEWMIVSP